MTGDVFNQFDSNNIPVSRSKKSNELLDSYKTPSNPFNLQSEVITITFGGNKRTKPFRNFLE